ncbi:MFS general substrate transporter [Lecanosticta acicola]|uniref:MFS general substrate transporter n=1 Tax=Lecanosticta acicola TaxID=111012 RepID=A0AAI9EB16_9PEZI|nr:MFS general substrate transporter [Lecanosticta acicola]
MDDFNDLEKNIRAALVSTVRSSNAAGNEDVAFHRSLNASIGSSIDAQNARLLGLSDRLISSATANTELVRPPRLKDLDAVEGNWKAVVDVVDSLLERADTALDEFTGAVKRLSPAAEQVRALAQQRHRCSFSCGVSRSGLAVSTGSIATQYRSHADKDSEDSKWPKDWRAWTCLFGGFLLMFNSWGIVNAYGTYASYYKDTLLPGQDLLRMNLIGSTQSFVVLALSMPVGRFLDAGHIQKLLIVGTVLVTLGSFLLGVVNGGGEQGNGSYGLTWLTQGFISGLGMACFFVSASQVVATWFKKAKSLAVGIVASGASIAGLIYPVMFRYLNQDLGFNHAQFCVSALTCATSALAIYIARPNPSHIIRTPETWFDINVFWDKTAFKRNRAFLWLVVSISFLFFGFYAVFFNLEEWAVDLGFGTRQANDIKANKGLPDEEPRRQIRTYWLLAIMNASSTLGRIGAGLTSDMLGALNVHCFVTYVASILVLCLWSLTSNLDGAIAFVVVFGAFSGAVIGLPPASVAYVLGPDPAEQAHLGQWTGMMYSCASVWGLTGPLIAGHLITHYKTYLTVQMWAGACMFLSATCMAIGIWCRRRSDKARAAAKTDATPARPCTTLSVSEDAEDEKKEEV